MAYSEPARTAPRPARMRRTRVAGLLVVIVAIAAALGSQSSVSLSSTVSLPSTASSPSGAASPIHRRRGEQGGPLGEADGAVPHGTTVFDDEVPGVAKLDPALLLALRGAATDAAGAVAHGCPAMYADPTHDPRMHHDHE